MFIANKTGLSAPAGSVTMQGGIDADNLWFTRTGDDLAIIVMGTRGKVVIDDWFSADLSARVKQINSADGQTIDHTRVDQLTSAMAAYAGSHSGFNATRVAELPSDPTLDGAFQIAWRPT